MSCSTKSNLENQIEISQKEVNMSCLAKVGDKAPDFTTTAYFNGNFMDFKLSENFGSWIMLCFYPADFTFV